jgi:hypothetical protein
MNRSGTDSKSGTPLTQVGSADVHDDPCDYVELLLDVQKGEVVSCEFFGEGRQAVPLTEPVIMKLVDDVIWPRGLARLERLIRRALR